MNSARRQLDLMARARCDGNWTIAALRLKGMAVSFHSAELAVLADEALDGAPGDPAVQRRLLTLLNCLEFGA
ncbi:Hpt domain-containing protein [Novosphingobium sp. FKTRR1]|uniref:Hpt domain-containing protein n=1 Tax=Novosphingobium sp. FKTRR1 TaxID=2879118 RepID=UPI00351D0D6F